jgi:hypothetical protein
MGTEADGRVDRRNDKGRAEIPDMAAIHQPLEQNGALGQQHHVHHHVASHAGVCEAARARAPESEASVEQVSGDVADYEGTDVRQQVVHACELAETGQNCGGNPEAAQSYRGKTQ